MAKELIINSVETFEEASDQIIRASQEEFSKFTQEKVDAICEAAAMAADKMRIPLAKMAHEETKAGIVVDKITKNNYAAEHVWNHMRHAKTCDVIAENKSFGTKRVASPIGVIGCVSFLPPTPTSTTIFKILIALKTRNCYHRQPASQGSELHHPRSCKNHEGTPLIAAGLPQAHHLLGFCKNLLSESVRRC